MITNPRLYIHTGLTPSQQIIILGGPGGRGRRTLASGPGSAGSSFGGSALPEPPLKVISPSVPSGSGGGSTTPTLTWLNGGGATSYNVFFNGVFAGNQATTSYTPAALSYLTTYTWRVDAVNAGGTTAGDTWSFTTIMGAFSYTPATSLLTWTDANGAGQSGNLAFFNTHADLSSVAVIRFDYGSIVTAISNLGSLPALVNLIAEGNLFTSIDLSHNPALVWVDFWANHLTTFDLSANPAVGTLFLFGNNSLPVSVVNTVLSQ